MAALLENQPGRRPLELPAGSPPGFRPLGYFLGPDGASGLQVALVEASGRPSTPAVRDLWKKRHGGTASPLLLIATYPHGAEAKAAICGPTGDPPTLVFDLDPSTVERVAVAALGEPNRHAAVRFLVGVLGELESELPGLRNEGLFASHHLRTGVTARHDWAEACKHGEGLLKHRGRELIEALGFTAQPRDSATFTLRAGADDTATAVAIFLDETETYEGAADRFMGNSPVSLALAKADADRLPFVVITRGAQIRIYAADKRIVGVGRKGRTETFLEANLALLPTESAGYLPLLFGAAALLPDGTFEQILERSKNYASDLSKRLRERVYADVVPSLATAIARRSALVKTLTETELRFLYEEALFILFRLVFIAYAEDKGLLPYATNDEYRQHALKTRAQRLADRWNEEELLFDAQATDLWSEAKQLFSAVDKGNSEWAVPAYDGGLFSSDPDISPVGAAIAALELNNIEFGPALAALLVDVGDEGTYGAIDFRSLSVREFGTIYEGLLESSLSLAQGDLALDKTGTYVPAKAGDVIVVATGEVYLHNQSGARKSSGAYFTKEFAVEHLLDHALEPALDEHIARLATLVDAGDEASAGERFFDFRVADIAMGSGHFLVNVVDHIEARLTSFLTEHPLAVVNAELAALRNTALDRLGDAAEGTEIEQAALVRRQVARRCVYGVDVNPIAVELARLALWIHTFVPGLPLSFLDRTLVCGNSLTGIGSLEEAVEAVEGHPESDGVMSLARDQIERYLDQARGPLRRLGRLSDATPADVAEAREAQAEATAAVAPAARLFDLAIAARLGEIESLLEVSDDMLDHHPGAERAHTLASQLQALHFPVSFPEVFLRERPGFDCIVGNPPWDMLQVEVHTFLSLRMPGLRALPQPQIEILMPQLRVQRPDLFEEYEAETARVQKVKETLFLGPYPGLSSGVPDLYKAFAWRFWQLMRDGGFVGAVLPRKAVEASGMTDWRRAMLANADFVDVTVLVNTAGWIFDDVHQQYTVVLVTLRRTHDRVVHLRGPFKSLEAYEKAAGGTSLNIDARSILEWSPGAVFPLLSDVASQRVFLKLRGHPPLGAEGRSWSMKGLRELHASDNKGDFVFESGPNRWPVYKGESFNLWQPETGTVFAWADVEHITAVLQARRQNQVRMRRSALFGMPLAWANDPQTLPATRPRVGWRDVSRATDSRTMRCALLPPHVVLVHQVYYLFMSHGEPTDEAFVLGVMSSIPYDWFARQFVESHATVEFVNSSPVPDPGDSPALGARVVDIAARLSAVDERYRDWADSVGVPLASVEAAEKDRLLAELDAAVALLYGLDEGDVTHIFETFHVGWDFGPRLEAVLQHYHRLRGLL